MTQQRGVFERLQSDLQRLQRWLWRWHFYSGLIFAPVIVCASISGAIFVWQQEVERITLADYKFVESAEARVSIDAMIDSGRDAVEGRFVSFDWSGRPGESAEVFIADAAGTVHVVWVDPHRGVALGSHERNRLFFSQVRDFHRFLWSGLPGRLTVELATSWTILLTLSGIVMWWNGTRRKRGQWKLFRRHKPYIVWRNWHTVPAVWLSGFVLIILVTGLAFSKGAGSLWMGGAAAAGAFPEAYTDPPTHDPDSGERLRYQTLVERAATEDAPRRVTIVPNEASDEVPMVFRGDRKNAPWTFSVTWIDPISGAIIERLALSEMTVAAQAFVAAYSIHVGWIGGLWTKLLATFLCLLLVFLVISGVAMWWLRRPSGKTGFPRKERQALPKWFRAVNGLLWVLFPAVGLSLLAVLLFGFTARVVRFSRSPA